MMKDGYRVIYPRGDKSKLAVAFVLDYEESEWKLASTKIFDECADCKTYAKSLALKYSKEYDGGEDEQDYLE